MSSDAVDVELEPRQQAVLEEARAFAAVELAPRAAAVEQGGIDRGLIAELGRRRYLGATFPERHGGLGLDPIAYGLLTEAIGKACCNTRALLTAHTSLVGETLLRWGSEQQVARYIPAMARGQALAGFALSEPEVGSDAARVQTCYVKRGTSFVLDGRKRWTTLGGIADLLLVFARDAAAPDDDRGGVTAFVIERDASGVSAEPMNGGLLAARGAHVAEIILDGVEVSEQAVVGRPGAGFAVVAATALDHGRYSVAWAGVAIAQAALEAMARYARQRQQFGRPIHEHQLVRQLIGEAVTQTHAARALCLQAGSKRRRGAVDALIETTIAKQFAARAAMRVASDAVQVHGGNGCFSEHPAERLFREARLLEIIEGTSQILGQLIGQHGVQSYAR